MPMANSFNLFLDTTGPEIMVFAPGYTVKNSLADFEIKANERLAVDQEFYFLDSEGKRQDVIFQYNGDSFLGWVDFGLFPEGIAVFYAQVMDEVGNPSPVVTHTLLIHQGAGIDVQLLDSDRKKETSSKGRETDLAASSRLLDRFEGDRKQELTATIRTIEAVAEIE